MKIDLKNGIGKNNEFASYHPLVIFTYFIGVIGVSMTISYPLIIGISFAVAFFYSVLLKGSKVIKFNVLVSLGSVMFTTLFNTLFTHDGNSVLFYINANRITAEAMCYGAFSGMVIATVIIWFSSFNFIVNGEMIMYIFSRISSVFGLLISMILRYIPLLKVRYDEINMGQKCLGKMYDGKFIGRIKDITKKTSILIAWSLESSIESADSMAARGYGLKGRSSFSLYKASSRDYFLGIIFILLIIAIIAVNIGFNIKMYFYPVIVVPKDSMAIFAEVLFFGAISAIPILIDILGEYRWQKLESKI